MAKHPSSHMGVGRGRFRKALKAVLLSRHGTANLEEFVRKEFNWECAYCGIEGISERLQLDHLWPESDGGCLVLGNVIPSCPTCNSDRRQIPWRDFMKTSVRVTGKRSTAQIDQQIRKISDYMTKHKQDISPVLDKLLTVEEMDLLRDFDLMLAAISDGSLAKSGYQKKSAITFGDPGAMFDELVAIARKHLLPGRVKV